MRNARYNNIYLYVTYFRVQSLSVQQLTCLAIQLANAIRYLHQQQIVHGDVATRNCMYVIIGRITLLRCT